MDSSTLRIVSLLPSATEIVAALGLVDCLVGRSHECDYPPGIANLPVCTAPKFNPEGTSRQIHDRVEEVLQAALSVYQIDLTTLKQLQPTHIVTQSQCEVCAVSLADVEKAVAAIAGGKPQVISLQPNTLEDVWADIRRVASFFERPDDCVRALQGRVQNCADRVADLPAEQRPAIACIEWTEPLMVAGNWIPELVALAGGRPVLGRAGKHSEFIAWEALQQADPEVIVFMPCGFDLERTRQEAQEFAERDGWQQLKAVRGDRVYVTDANAYFNRPGPRLVESLEILGEILHGDRFDFGRKGKGWQSF